MEPCPHYSEGKVFNSIPRQTIKNYGRHAKISRQVKWKLLSRVQLMWPHRLYTVHGLLQARILEWGADSFSRGSSQPRGRAQFSHIVGGFFTSWVRHVWFQMIYSYTLFLQVSTQICIKMGFLDHLYKRTDLTLTLPPLLSLKHWHSTFSFSPLNLKLSQ